MNKARGQHKAGAATERTRALMGAWVGGPLSVEQIAALTGLPRDKRLHNALEYLRTSGVCVRVQRGLYRPSKREGRQSQ